MQAPGIGTFGAANASVVASIGDRVTPVATMVGMVSIVSMKCNTDFKGRQQTKAFCFSSGYASFLLHTTVNTKNHVMCSVI